ncbi:MAG: fructosamine kinase family protein [Bacteroidota bacterium]|nr:fructosamine kinase family protein [Flavisolibacter sp.]MBD0351776.1 fructosamine kinase family protein [Flavisolibacter sp.]MBD0365841.1 fructosamine kinase family protein [Flavisolibacter sp.]MDQ3844875.1 fructosamine kinase family protein [Bacteroidota bacterium]
MPLTNNLKESLQKELGIQIRNVQTIGGGCINETYKIIAEQSFFFCKINSATKFPQLFQKEASGLSYLKKQNVIKLPDVLAQFEEAGKQVLVLEWITTGTRTESFWKNFGTAVAALHHVSHTYFGFEEDNYMGSIPQPNNPANDWVTFFKTQRLEPLVLQCVRKELLTERQVALFEKIYQQLPGFFEVENPALLHGDLWSGNFMCNSQSEPVLIDPAVYYGHRSIDLGMSTLFGGFRNNFYEAYHYHYPLPKNYEEQWQLCNLYALLIHLFLFGKSYLPQIENIMQRFQ